MTRALSVALIASAVALLGGCGKAEFKPYSSAEGKFSCEFPGSPKEETQSAAGVPMKMIGIDGGNVAYAVTYADMPIPANESADGIQDRLDGVRDGMLSSLGGKLKSESRIELDGKHPGREIRADLPEGKGTVRARVFFVGTRLYQVMVIGEKGFAESADTLRFLNSLKLTP